MHHRIKSIASGASGATTRRSFLKVCGTAAIALAGSSTLLKSGSGLGATSDTWLPIPPQVWEVGTPVYLDLADYCTDPGVDPASFQIDQPLPPGVTLIGSVVSGTPTAPAAVSNFVVTAEVTDPVTGVPTQGQTPVARPSLVAFPNPAAGAVRFSGERRSSEDASGLLRVFAVSGRMVYEKPVHVSGNRFELAWDGRTRDGGRLASGLYLVTVRAGSEMARTRLIVTQ